MNRVAIVTGGSRGFGLATARALATSGWSLVIDAREETALQGAADELRKYTSVTAVAGDVTDAAHRTALIDAAGIMGSLGLLINNASVLGPSPQPHLDTYPVEVLRHVYEVNVLGPLALIQLALPRLRETRGTIINITSDAANGGYAGWGGYGSSKAALSELSHVLAAEEEAVRVYWFDPGDMNTQMHQEAFPGEDISDRPAPEASVPSLLRLIDGTQPSGWYHAERDGSG